MVVTSVQKKTAKWYDPNSDNALSNLVNLFYTIFQVLFANDDFVLWFESRSNLKQERKIMCIISETDVDNQIQLCVLFLYNLGRFITKFYFSLRFLFHKQNLHYIKLQIRSFNHFLRVLRWRKFCVKHFKFYWYFSSPG